MGEDKSLLPFGSYNTLAEFQYKKLQQIFNKVYISTKDPSKFPFQAEFIVDKYTVYAPTAGFCSVFESLNSLLVAKTKLVKTKLKSSNFICFIYFSLILKLLFYLIFITF